MPALNRTPLAPRQVLQELSPNKVNSDYSDYTRSAKKPRLSDGHWSGRAEVRELDVEVRDVPDVSVRDVSNPTWSQLHQQVNYTNIDAYEAHQLHQHQLNQDSPMVHQSAHAHTSHSANSPAYTARYVNSASPGINRASLKHSHPHMTDLTSSPPAPSSFGRLASPVPLLPLRRGVHARTASSAQRLQSEMDEACRTHAWRLQNRLRIAYYKVLTNQTHVSLANIEEPAPRTQVPAHPAVYSKSMTPVRPTRVDTTNSLSSTPLPHDVRGTPASMGAAKSLLKLGTF